MALKPSVSYPSQTDADANYPWGKARNKSTPSAVDGTPLENGWVNDLWGFLQSLVGAGRVTPNGNPDSVDNDQYLQALYRMWDPRFVLTSLPGEKTGTNMYPGDPVKSSAWILSPNFYAASNDKICRSRDSGRTWEAANPTDTNGMLNFCAAADDTGKAIVTGDRGGGSAIQYTTDVGDNWTRATPPSTPISLRAAHYCASSETFIVAGNTASGPYLAIADRSDLSTWTALVVPAGITGVKTARSIVELNGVIVASWEDQDKVAFSTDGGATWSESTTTLTSGDYIICAGENEFLAIDADDINAYTSTDGDTWTAFADDHPGSGVFGLDRSTFKFLGGVYVIHAFSKPLLHYNLMDGGGWHTFSDVSIQRTYRRMAVIDGQLLKFREDGGDSQEYVERSIPVQLP